MKAYLESSSSTEEPTITITTTAMGSNNKHRRGTTQDPEEDPQVWRSLNSSFKQVQSVLDRNRALIQQVNENHQSKVADNMVKNVALIQEINGNISKVVSIYSDMSSNFSTAFRDNKNGDDDD